MQHVHRPSQVYHVNFMCIHTTRKTPRNNPKALLMRMQSKCEQVSTNSSLTNVFCKQIQYLCHMINTFNVVISDYNYCNTNMQCDSGRCLMLEEVCDGITDCAGGEDEVDCLGT